ncbi:MAG: hypothetical protein F6K19_47920 [Cyanothece sp. SIO1E1]|nr:hypothetical protein [Cyanothece sp. SIO1E1]
MEQSLNRKLDIQSGRFMAIGIHRTPEGGTQLLMVIHHLVMDAVSWPILLLDLSSLLKTITGQEKPRFLKPSGSYAQWTEDLLETAAAIEPDTIAFWEDTTDTDAENGPSYDASGHQMMETLSFQLSKADTSRFLDLIRRKNRANPQHVLLAALAATFREWHDTKQVVFELEGHGREATKLGTDTSHTIGWFTSKFPLALDLEKSSSTEDILRTVSSKMDRLPMNGASYGLVRYLHADEKVRSNTTVTKSVHAGFNYLGVAEQLVPAESGFRLIKPLSLVSSVENHSPLPIDVHAMIFQSTLKVEWRYDARLHDRSVIEKHGRRCMEHLGVLIETETKQTKTTVADFSQAGLDKSKLSNLAAVLDKLK